jgi:hypothetical protein
MRTKQGRKKMKESEEGITESMKATVLKRTPVDFTIEFPFVGSDAGDDLGTQKSRVSGVHRSKYVTKSGEVIREYDDETLFQDIYKLSDVPEHEAVIEKQEAEDQHSLLQKVVNWLTHDHLALREKVNKADVATSPLPPNKYEDAFEKRAILRQSKDGGSYEAAYAIERNLDSDLAMKADALRTKYIASWEAMK